ncbi:MAG: hypothetical protein NXI10_06625 [bacterium]|nr:hypothetical protein [bacterium]
MSLVSERYNILYLNDSNIVDFRSTGYRKDQIILKGDANTTVINKKNGWPIVVPSSETFELSIYEIASDSLIYTEQFIAITKGTLSKIQENPINPGSHCDHIFSYKNENTLFRSRENHLYLRRQHYDDSLISFEVFNGTLLSDDPNKVIIRPGDDILTMVTVYYDGKMILSKQYMVQD